jgi:hypothetical protein
MYYQMSGSHNEIEPSFGSTPNNTEANTEAPRSARAELGGRILALAKGTGRAALRGALGEQGLGLLRQTPEGRTEIHLAGAAKRAGQLIMAAETGTLGLVARGMAAEAAQGARQEAKPVAQAHIEDAVGAAITHVGDRVANFIGGPEPGAPAPDVQVPTPRPPVERI